MENKSVKAKVAAIQSVGRNIAPNANRRTAPLKRSTSTRAR
jgi:hypothetical protein